MKVAPRNIDSFLKSPPDNIDVVLIYGRDLGLVHERAAELAKVAVADVNDPFLVSDLNGSEVKSDPPKLSDEASAQSLVGGRRLVLVRLGGEDISKALKLVLDGPEIASLVIIEGGDLAASSPNRKLLEKSDRSAVIACYEDNEQSLGRLIETVSREYQIKIDRAARDYLVGHLGGDRMVSRRELEKLMLYAGSKSDVSLEDAVAVVGDSGALSLEEVIYAAAGGDRAKLEEGLSRAVGEGVSPIAILRAAQRHLLRLQLAAARCAEGQSPAEAMKALKPPVMFLFSDRFQRQLSYWTTDKLSLALDLLLEAEADCKSTGLPDQAICERSLLRLSQVARQTINR